MNKMDSYYKIYWIVWISNKIVLFILNYRPEIKIISDLSFCVNNKYVIISVIQWENNNKKYLIIIQLPKTIKIN